MPVAIKIHKRNSYVHFQSFMLLICLVTILRNILSVNIPVSVYLLLSALVAVICSKSEIIAYMCALLPMGGMCQYRLALFIVTGIYLLKIRKPIIRRIIPLCLMIMWEVYHAPQSQLVLYGLVQEFSELIAISIVLMDSEVDYSDPLPLRVFGYMAVWSSIVNFIVCRKYFGFSLSSLTRLGNLSGDIPDFQGMLNPNTNSFICLIAVSVFLLLKSFGCEKKSDKLIILLLAAFIVFTQSKAALVCLVAVYFLYYVFDQRRQTTSEDIIQLFFALILCAVAGAVFLRDVIKKVISRFLAADISTGRIAIFKFYHDHLCRDPRYLWKGIGLYRYTKQIRALYGDLWQKYPGIATMAKGELVYKPCHMGFQEIVVAWGVIGLLLMGLLFCMMLKSSRRIRKKTNYVTMLIILIFSSQGEFISSGSILLALFISLLCLNYYNNMPEELPVNEAAEETGEDRL